ncbi:early light-induced protein 1, chloroplastic-like [Andrographis paniculata]|uniref:early light-induced protein 1, chloroplastic-like n=1 Tax=Andrographis paniculata TaxID=175694 RepID=UPI0021E7BE90|nr:early light-induced protein 1, chloroplastic-like [Andrographis paniculata]
MGAASASAIWSYGINQSDTASLLLRSSKKATTASSDRLRLIGASTKVRRNYNYPRSQPRRLAVRCMAEPEEKEIKDLQEKAETLQQPPLTPPPKPKVSTRFEDVLAFGGPGPERINGRLAMIGFAAAIGVEIAKGQGIFSQIEMGGVPWFLGTSLVLSLASLIPMFKGVTVESRSGDLMSSDAELWNGRFAMLGLVALAFTEFLKGGALINNV